MISNVLPAVLASFLIASSVTASPIIAARQSGATGDNGSCAKMHDICASSVNKNVTNPWSFKECIFGASCFGGQRPVDDFLASIYSTIHNGTSGTPPVSLKEPRVSTQVFDSISTDKKVITQQNWIDGYYSTLSQTSGPYPTNVSAVIDYYNRVAEWTAFCTGGVPASNFADYYQYSASVNSPGCASVPPVISSDATCQKMFTTCIGEVDSAVDDIFQHKSCMLGASCFGGQRPVSGFLAAVYGVKHSAGTAPTPAKETRLSQTVFNSISTDGGKTMSQQNFIDAWYSQLTTVGGPYPINSNLVISYYQRISEWTGFCQRNVPYGNTADYFQYSSTVNGSEC